MNREIGCCVLLVGFLTLGCEPKSPTAGSQPVVSNSSPNETVKNSTLPGSHQPPPRDEPVPQQDETLEAKKQYLIARRNATNQFKKDFEACYRAAAAKGDLQLVKTIDRERRAFEVDDLVSPKEPEMQHALTRYWQAASPEMQEALTRYGQAINAARVLYHRFLSEKVKHHTKMLQIKEAEKYDLLMKQSIDLPTRRRWIGSNVRMELVEWNHGSQGSVWRVDVPGLPDPDGYREHSRTVDQVELVHKQNGTWLFLTNDTLFALHGPFGKVKKELAKGKWVVLDDLTNQPTGK